MKNSLAQILLVAVILLLALPQFAEAQFREHSPDEYDYTGEVIQTRDDRYQPGNWADMLNMKMAHSYSMTFSSVGGQYQNLNMYTNTMFFDFSKKLDGRLDVSFAHSPFGNNPLMGQQQNGLGGEIFIRNAELNYQLSDNASIHVSFQQRPYSPFGMSRFGSYGNQHMNPWY